MTALGRILLISWIPVTLIVFLVTRPSRKATFVAVIMAWLVLPTGGLEISGLPDYTKATAAALGTLAAVAIFDGSRLTAFRPKWFDLPMLVFCLSPIASSVWNDLGTYDGLSASFTNFMIYWVPYVLGRTYITDSESLKAGLVVFVGSTLIYSLPTLWEIRMSPHLQTSFYGVVSQLYQPPRFGLGYRPNVFLTNGLELGLWIAFAAIFASAILASEPDGTLRGIPTKWVFGFLVILGLLTKSIGAIVLMLLGIATLWALKRTGKQGLLWVLVLVPILYIGTRSTGLWSGDNLVELTMTYLGPERASSIETRFYNENQLVAKAMERPVFGWGGFGRSRVYDEYGRDVTLSDGLWVIYLGSQGVVGLTSLMLSFLVPPATVLWRMRKAKWKGPEAQPLAAAVVVCTLFTCDSLLNSNPNPFYFMLIGGLAGFTAVPRRSDEEAASGYQELGLRLAGQGAYEDAEVAYRLALQGYARRPAEDTAGAIGSAGVRRSLGLLLEALGRHDEAEDEFRTAVAAHDRLDRLGVHPGAHAEAWSASLDSLARFYKNQGRDEEAEVTWRRSLEALEAALAGASPGDRTWRAYADRQNDLAWLLALPNDPSRADPNAAAHLAQRATTILPDEPCLWNTLGVARFYAGDERGAIEALSRSIQLAGEGNAFDYYVMAMACVRAGEPGVARQWYHQGERWKESHGSVGHDLERVRNQAGLMIADAEALRGE